MATAMCSAPLMRNGVQSMTATQKSTLLRPELEAIVKKILSLRSLTETTGFFTHRDVGDLLRPLSIDDMAVVADELKKRNCPPLKLREMPRR
jgi:hypothetical protein